MDLADALRIGFRLALGLTGFAVGLASARRELAYLPSQPGLLLRTFFATVVFAPVVALFLWRALPIGAPAAVAIIAGSLAPGLPAVPQRLRRVGGSVAFATSFVATTSVLGLVTIPAWLAILRSYAGIDVAVSTLEIARLLGLGLLVPLLSGVAVRRFAPRVAQRLAGPVGALADAILPCLALVVLVLATETLRHLGWAALSAMVVASLAALAIGHVLGGPRPRDRTALALANATRFPALAALIASSSFPELRAMPAVVAYAVVAYLVTIPYALARRSVHREGEAPRSEGATPSLDQASTA